MASLDGETYRYLQIERAVVSGAERFLPAVADIGQRVLSMAAVASMPELTLDDHEELVTAHRPLHVSRLDVYSVHDLKMVLFRRVATNVMSSRFNFMHHAAEFTARRKSGQSRSHAKPLHRAGKSSQDLVNDIAANTSNRVATSSITTGHDPVLGRFLALVPTNLTLAKQAEEAFEQMKGVNQRIAHGSNSAIPHVPFASLPADITDSEYAHLLDGINGLSLPTLTLGSVEAEARTALPRQNPLLADD